MAANTEGVEDPNKVVGGPGAEAAESEPTETKTNTEEPKPLHKGFDREITTPEDLVKYTKDLETLLVAQKTTSQSAPSESQPFSDHQTPPANTGETFEDLVYTDPAKAKAVLLKEFEDKQNFSEARRKAEGVFWEEFYQKNADLKDLRHVVQSVFDRDQTQVKAFRTNREVAEHVANESRKIVDLVKSKVGITETKIDSKPALTIAGSGGGGGSQPAPQKPQSFAEQIARFRKRGK